MKLRNVLFASLALALIVVAGALWWLWSSRDALLKEAIEKFGPDITSVPVSVERVRLEPLKGKGTIAGLKLGNPKGFEAPNAFTLGEMQLSMDPASITKNVVVIRQVELLSPEITYERGGGSSNLEVIQKNVDGYVARLAGPKEEQGPKKKFVVENLYVRGAKLHYGTSVTLPLPDIHLRDIGKKSNGASAGEVVKQTWDALARSSMNLASRAGAAIKRGANNVIEGARRLFK